MVVMTPRESWTDVRLDEFEKPIDERFDGIDLRFDEVDRRFDGIDRRFERLEAKMEAGFETMASRWDRLTGILIIGLLGLIGTQL